MALALPPITVLVSDVARGRLLLFVHSGRRGVATRALARLRKQSLELPPADRRLPLSQRFERSGLNLASLADYSLWLKTRRLSLNLDCLRL